MLQSETADCGLGNRSISSLVDVEQWGRSVERQAANSVGYSGELHRPLMDLQVGINALAGSWTHDGFRRAAMSAGAVLRVGGRLLPDGQDRTDVWLALAALADRPFADEDSTQATLRVLAGLDLPRVTTKIML